MGVVRRAHSRIGLRVTSYCKDKAIKVPAKEKKKVLEISCKS